MSGPFRTAAIAAFGGIVAAAVTSGLNYWSRDRELNIRLVEIGIGILRDDPEKSGVFSARRWAIEVIQNNSGVNFTQDERNELLRKPLGYEVGQYIDYGGYYQGSRKPVNQTK